MDPMKSEASKSQVAVFIPYRRNGNVWEFYLQKRTADAVINPGLLGTFGGSLETGESPYQALLREVKEELDYEPLNLRYFSRYENSVSIKYVYIEQVANDFESKVTIGEGDYGKFVSLSEMENVRLFTRTVQSVIPELAKEISRVG